MISIAMTNYNGDRFIENAIKSILVQTYKDWELVIVDDCSTDKSLNVISKLLKQYNIEKKTVLIKRQKNGGYGIALKTAIESASGELVAIVDSDDALNNKKALEMCVDAHIKHPSVALTYSNYVICNHALKPKKVYRTRQIPKGKTCFNSGVRVSHLKVLKKSFYNKTEGIDDYLRKAVDKDLVFKIEEVGKLLHIDEVLYKYRKHPGTLTVRYSIKSRLGKKSIEYRERIYTNTKRRRGLL